MNEKKLTSALQYVDEELLEEAMHINDSNIRNTRITGRTLRNLIVACLCIVVCGFLFSRFSFKGMGYEEAEATTCFPEELTEPLETGDCWVTPTSQLRVAMICDAGELYDMSLNQWVYETCASWSASNGVEYTYYKPTEDTTNARVSSIELAVEEGFNALLLPGSFFAEAIIETAELYPDVNYIALDISEDDLRTAGGPDYCIPPNVYYCTYREELAGFMAGVAAVELGYTELGFLGSFAVPDVMRYGYGFLQGVDHAAGKSGTDVHVKFACANLPYGDPNITAYMEKWYEEGTQVVFACGGSVFASVAEAAALSGGKIIGCDVDQKLLIDSAFCKGITVTSAVKEYGKTVEMVLTELYNGNWESLIIGEAFPDSDPCSFVGLADSTQYADSFTSEDYEALRADLSHGTISVSDDVHTEPVVPNITVDYQGNIK